MSTAKERERIRLLMLAKKSERRRVTSKLAKYGPNGALSCKVCRRKVNEAAWESHIRSDEHNQAIKQLKERRSGKRKAQEASGNASMSSLPPQQESKRQKPIVEKQKEPLAEPMELVSQVAPAVNISDELANFKRALNSEVQAAERVKEITMEEFSDEEDAILEEIVLDMELEAAAQQKQNQSQDNHIKSAISAVIAQKRSISKKQQQQEQEDEDDSDEDIFDVDWMSKN